MISRVQKLYDQLLSELEEIKAQQIPSIKKMPKALVVIVSVLERLHMEIQDYKFENVNEEITFYKYSLPSIMALYFQYTVMYSIELGRPVGSIRAYRQYLEHE